MIYLVITEYYYSIIISKHMLALIHNLHTIIPRNLFQNKKFVSTKTLSNSIKNLSKLFAFML